MACYPRRPDASPDVRFYIRSCGKHTAPPLNNRQRKIPTKLRYVKIYRELYGAGESGITRRDFDEYQFTGPQRNRCLKGVAGGRCHGAYSSGGHQRQCHVERPRGGAVIGLLSLPYQAHRGGRVHDHLGLGPRVDAKKCRLAEVPMTGRCYLISG